MIQYETNSLAEAFDINKKDKVIAVVGAGGKTTLIDFLAQELAEKGFHVGIMTTTHRYYPQKFDGIEKEEKEILELLKRDKIVEVGNVVQEMRQPLKTGPISEKMYQWIKNQVDFLLVEADGAKRMPIKVPALWEPVLYPDMKKVIVVAGLCGVGKKWKEACFRWDSCFSKEEGEDIIQADQLIALMQSVYAQKDERKWIFFLNQWDCIMLEKQKKQVESAVAISRSSIRWGQLLEHSEKKIKIWRME